MIARIINTKTGQEETLTRHAWYLCPHVVGYKTVCGYWESRLDLFSFACEVVGFDYESCEWIDGETGEILTFWDLVDEYEELEAMEA